jgi:hypothetical protein
MMACLWLRFCCALAALLFTALPGWAAVTLEVGKNFTGATYGIDSTAQPPDAALAVSSNHIVEFINGRYSVFSKATAARVQTKSDSVFWNNAGIGFGSGFVSDPRVVFDPVSQRWFAAEVDVPSSGANRFLLAVSDNVDPTALWRGVAFIADPVTEYFADFPTLGVDANGVYLSADMFTDTEESVGPLLVSIPKQDLLGNSPSVARRTSSGVLDYTNYGAVLQPALSLGPTTGNEVVLAIGDLGYDFESHSNLVVFAVENAASSNASFSTPISLPVPPYSVPLNPPQPGGADNLDDGDARLGASVYRVGDFLYAVHAVEVSNRAAIQWFQVNATNSSLMQSGTITDPVLHLFFPSIAANAAGTVVIAFNGCSTNSFISSYAAVGEPLNGSLSFGNLVLLKAGQAGYRTNNASISRWGDYGALSPDPADPARFWSLTMYPSGTTAWSTQISELITGPLKLGIQLSGTNATLKWSGSVSGYQLESSTTLSSTNWTPVAQSVVLTNNQYSVSVPATNALSVFFRLRK